VQQVPHVVQQSGSDQRRTGSFVLGHHRSLERVLKLRHELPTVQRSAMGFKEMPDFAHNAIVHAVSIIKLVVRSW
jgi:hypothetical protein